MTPYTAGKILQAISECEYLMRRYPTAEEVTWNRVKIKMTALRKGLLLYKQALRGYLYELLKSDGVACTPVSSLPDDALAGLVPSSKEWIEWVDLAGLIVPAAAVNHLLDEVDSTVVNDLDELANRLKALDRDYPQMVARWAVYALETLLGKPAAEITAGDLRQVMEQGASDRRALAAAVAMDVHRDFAPLMAVGYGIDSEACRDADFRAVRGEEPAVEFPES